ncbi:3-oxoacyl-ACP reductase family protein [Streptomyces sp. NPDC005356]|uniref:SDR family NAD(P)-dependent oxidoreductase n=1 Tax=unclassified Streptomyces TaxID=2593676 RepID=UPI0033AE7353
MAEDLSGRVALVTGAGRGIGRAIAERLAAAGAAVAVCDVDGDTAGKTAGELAETHGVGTVGVTADISDSEQVREALSTVRRQLGPVNLLVNNAAVDVVRKFMDTDEADWDRIISVNLRGTITVTRAVLDHMIEGDGGRIVNIASDAGRVGSSGEVVYSATKGGVIAFGKALAREVARHGITINTVAPGPTETSLLGQVNDFNPKIVEATVRSIPLRRVAQPDDIAGVVAFLASDSAAYMTGQTVSVSGGLTMM